VSVAIPETFQLAGGTWKVRIVSKAKMQRVVECFKDECQGACSVHKRTIYILDGMDAHTTEWTFYHELGHAIRAVLGYEDSEENHAELDGWASMVQQFLASKKGKL